MDIEQRAKKYVGYRTNDYARLAEAGYKSGATDQRDIDTEVFCELFYELLNGNHIDCKDSAYVESRIRKALNNE